jgi:hypothetical protein
MTPKETKTRRLEINQEWISLETKRRELGEDVYNARKNALFAKLAVVQHQEALNDFKEQMKDRKPNA